MSAPPNVLDPRSLADRLLRHAESMRAYVCARIPQAFNHTVSAEDVLQESWVAAYLARDTFRDTGPHAFDRWLTTIVSTRLIDALRRAGRQKRAAPTLTNGGCSSSLAGLLAELVWHGHTPSQSLAGREVADAVMVALAGLSEDRRTAVQLRYFEGLGLAEIAARMAKSQESVHSLLFHACNQLRELLGPASRYLGRGPVGPAALSG